MRRIEKWWRRLRYGRNAFNVRITETLAEIVEKSTEANAAKIAANVENNNAFYKKKKKNNPTKKEIIMFKSLIGLATDIVEIAVAPIEIAVDVTRTVTKPVADMATETAAEVKSAAKDLT